MPYKKGGGNHLQFYRDDDGQYDDQAKAKLNENDMKALVLYHYYGISDSDTVFHFPVFGIHDNDYCNLFVFYARKVASIIAPNKPDKAKYLLSYSAKNDKSVFLTDLGYSIERPYELLNDIVQNTNMQTLSFSKMTPRAILCIAKTVLRGKIVTTVWSIDTGLNLSLVTLIPGGDKRWK